MTPEIQSAREALGTVKRKLELFADENNWRDLRPRCGGQAVRGYEYLVSAPISTAKHGLMELDKAMQILSSTEGKGEAQGDMPEAVQRAIDLADMAIRTRHPQNYYVRDFAYEDMLVIQSALRAYKPETGTVDLQKLQLDIIEYWRSIGGNSEDYQRMVRVIDYLSAQNMLKAKV